MYEAWVRPFREHVSIPEWRRNHQVWLFSAQHFQDRVQYNRVTSDLQSEVRFLLEDQIRVTWSVRFSGFWLAVGTKGDTARVKNSEIF